MIVVFQPHQYSRTIELLDWFLWSFDSVDTLIIPDIYFCRDTEEDVKNMPAEKFVKLLKEKYENVIYWNWLENTSIILKNLDESSKNSCIIVLLWAWNVDDLRNIIF